MFENLSYKRKNRLLFGAAGLFLFLSYWMAFKSTFTLCSEVRDLEAQIELANDAPQKVAILQSRLAELDMLPGIKQNADTSIQQELLGIVTGYCKGSGIVLREFPRTLVSEEGEYRVETNVFTVEGGFSKLLQLVYLLEQKNRLGKIASVQYNAKKDVRTKMLSLTASVYVQNIKKINNEK